MKTKLYFIGALVLFFSSTFISLAQVTVTDGDTSVSTTNVITTTAAPYTQGSSLNRNLSVGSTGNDVRTLQIILNKNTQTKIANTGVGSPGNETDYFGNLTKAAVVRFQELYRADVLTPVGLFSGTGFVGPSTLTKLRSIQGSGSTVYIPPTLPTTGSSIVFQFKNNMTIGSRGSDVLALQKLLNVDPLTRVALTGVGSKGNETDYFGNLTKVAVIRFQEKYRDSVLTPVGLFSGTGFVGPSTLAELNRLGSTVSSVISSSNTIENNTDTIVENNLIPEDVQASTVTSGATETVSDSFMLGLHDSYEGPTGTELNIQGFGFSPQNNTVYFGKHALTNVSSDGDSITFRVPHTIPAGPYDIEVVNADGEKALGTAFFAVTYSNVESPEIYGVSPSTGFYGEKITIHGTGFTKSNQIRLSYDDIDSVVSPDGKTLTFEAFPDVGIPNLEVGVDLGRGIEWPISIHVANENGVSKEEVLFILKI